MSIPFVWPHVDASQVIIPPGQQSNYPDIGHAFLQAFLGSQQLKAEQARTALSAQQHRDQLAMEQQRIDLARGAQQTAAEHDAAAQAQLAREGEAIRAWATSGAPLDKLPPSLGGSTVPLMQGSDAGAAGVPGAPGGPSNMTPASSVNATALAGPATTSAPPTANAGKPGAVTALPIPNNPLSMLGPLLQNMRAEDIPGAVQKLIPVLGLQASFQEQSDKYNRINTALTNIKDPAKRAGAVALMGLAEGGVHLTPEQVSKVLPQLAVVDPSTLNSAVEFWTRSQQPWGRIRSVFGLPASQVPDGITYTGPAGKDASGKLTTGQQEALMQLPILQQSNAVMSAQESAGTELGLLGAYLKKNPTGALGDFLNKQQTPAQREYLTAQLRFSDVAAYAFSGKTASQQERVRVINDFSAQGSDPQAVKEQKARARQALILSLQDRLTGQLTPVQAADRLLKTPGLLSPEQRQTIMQLRKQGAAYEQAQRTGRGLPVTVTDTPSTPDVLMSDSAKVQSIIEQLPDSALGVRPQPQRGAPRNPGAFDSLLDFSRALTPSVTPPRAAP